MQRRLVAVFLLPCLVLTQSAVRGHAHADDPAFSFDSRPHFHASSPPSLGHSHGGHHHHDHESPDDDVAGESGFAPHSDHDSDAVYLAAIDAVIAKLVTGADKPAQAADWVGVPAPGFGVLFLTPAYLIHSGHSPPSASSPPLYLTQRTLLI